MKCFGVILAALGVLLMIGTAGASDTNAIPFMQIVVQVTLGLIMLGAGVIWTRIAEQLKRVKERKYNK